MKHIGRAAGLLLVALAGLLVVECSVERVNAPQVPPESTVMVGPEARVPKEFVGCWEGTVDAFDTAKSYTLLSDDYIRTSAAHTTYEFCFSSRPSGTGQLELKKVQVRGNELRISHFDNRVTAFDPERYRGKMRNHGIVEATVWLLWIIPMHVQQEVYAEEEFQMKSRDVVFVQGKQLLVIHGAVSAEMTFHTDFHRVSEMGTNSGVQPPIPAAIASRDAADNPSR
jgi:hypothetical protein